MTAPDRYGQRKVSKMIREWDAHRQACRAEGTPAIQATLDAMEEHIDYAYRVTPAPAAMTPEVRALVDAASLLCASACSEDFTTYYDALQATDAALAALRAGGDA